MRVLAVFLVQLAVVVEIFVQHPLILANEKLGCFRSLRIEGLQLGRLRRNDECVEPRRRVEQRHTDLLALVGVDVFRKQSEKQSGSEQSIR